MVLISRTYSVARYVLSYVQIYAQHSPKNDANNIPVQILIKVDADQILFALEEYTDICVLRLSFNEEGRNHGLAANS